ncbi:MAG TPA: iron-containing alcohol dehydrogenase [Streptosporangiaceae bacterium]|nr:iron-containing alcohol dehydrogenase [Streptosporangiaceae bacterium]
MTDKPLQYDSGGTTPRNLPHPALRRQGTGIAADGEFYMPTRALFGRGIASQAAEHALALGASSVLLVTDPGVRATGLIAPVETALTSRGIDVTVFDRVEPNPKDEDCLAGAELIRSGGQQLLVAVGGGSAIDTAKCIGLLLTNGGHPRDWEDFGALRRDPLPTIAIPTTAGTGSEVSPSAVITDTARKKKMNLFDTRNCPRVALVDPDLTLSCPAWVTASSGMDALSHAVDSLQCLLATPASDALALEGARLVARYIRRAVGAPADIEARCGMAQGSLTAGLAVGLTDVSGAHALAEAMGGLYGHPHGFCCAVSMPAIMEYNLPMCADKYARLAVALGAGLPGASEVQLAQAAIGAIRDLNRDLDVPAMSTLVRAEDLDLLGEKAAQNTSTPSNPRIAGAADYREMFAREIERHR